MKHEVKGNIINELVGLKSKMYTLAIANNEANKKGKGINKIVVKNIRHKEYVDDLFNKYFIRHKTKGIQTK